MKKNIKLITIILSTVFVAVLCIVFFRNPHLEKSLYEIPGDKYLNADFEVIGNELYHFDRDISSGNNHLIVSDLTSSFKRPKKLAIENCVSLKAGGAHLYVLRKDDSLAILDTTTKELVAELDLKQCEFKGSKINERIEYSLGCADENGAYVVIKNTEKNWIVNATPSGEISVIAKLDSMSGNIHNIMLNGANMILDYNDADEPGTGTYLLHTNTGEIRKISDMSVFGGNDDMVPPFMWNDYYVAHLSSSTLLFLPLGESENKRTDLNYSSSSMWSDKDYLYTISGHSLGRYNLLTDEWEISNQKDKYEGTLKIANDWVVVACYINTGNSSVFKFICEPLDVHQWSPTN